MNDPQSSEGGSHVPFGPSSPHTTARGQVCAYSDRSALGHGNRVSWPFTWWLVGCLHIFSEPFPFKFSWHTWWRGNRGPQTEQCSGMGNRSVSLLGPAKGHSRPRQATGREKLEGDSQEKTNARGTYFLFTYTIARMMKIEIESEKNYPWS